mgnify:CR=1 FL=1
MYNFFNRHTSASASRNDHGEAVHTGTAQRSCRHSDAAHHGGKQLAARLPKDKASLAKFQKIGTRQLRAMMTDQLPPGDESVVSKAKDGTRWPGCAELILSRRKARRACQDPDRAWQGLRRPRRHLVHPERHRQLYWKDGKLVPSARERSWTKGQSVSSPSRGLPYRCQEPFKPAMTIGGGIHMPGTSGYNRAGGRAGP